jgi:DNA-directed RNA polymerase subunit RPC12/RpoP
MAAITEEYRYPCEQCGSELRFAAGQAGLKCSHCGHVQRIVEAGSETPWVIKGKAFDELDLAHGLKNDLPAMVQEDVRTMNCPNCGAMVEFQGAIHATECPFCATPLVVDSGSHRMIKPQALIPFQLDEPSARKALIAWLGRLWFAPSRLLEFTRAGRAMNGVYIPYWTFDANTRSQYRGARGDYYYETRTVIVNVNGRNEQRQERVQKIRWRPASGNVTRRFDDVIVIAATSLPADLCDGLEPWDLAALQSYRPDYIAGFQAEGYTVALADGHQTGRDKMNRVIAQDVRRDIGGDVQRVDRVDSDFRAETFKHILLPVWIAAYKYGGKSYRFLVNGQTGEVQGERPWSVWKIAFAVLGAMILAACLAYLYYLNNPDAFH